MGRKGYQLLVISRDVLLLAEHSPLESGIFRALANLTRKGCHLLLTAPEPDKWLPTRGRVDHVLTAQSRLQKGIQECGGDLDGVYYVPRSLFTQDRNRRGALEDIMRRFGVSAKQTLLVSNSAPFLKAADGLGIETREVPRGDSAVDVLAKTITTLE
ncbi:hypothetical protein F3N42_09260 [Marinihelvus fidelis]|uniref:Uncharacterized protein n=1 Tax=Marinihelvus fidelis TaxID=2613842 RepID=A0A5N0T904_9GAMM|nr:hypothetical protein [Marinihelvus fidelis]KAA9131495.1 hypothetical protein F3N42_09260 [Marinihelvus fidelis]